MTRVAAIALALLLAVPAAAVPSAAAKAGDVRVLASVDGTPITTKDLEELLASQPAPGPSNPLSGVSADGVLQRLIENRLLEEEGFRIGADRDPDVAAQVWDLRRHRGMLALLDSVRNALPAVDEANFDVAMSRTSTMWRVFHIRTATEAGARALRDSLKTGAPFGELARRHSTDSTSAKRDGELGWAREDLYIPEFRSVLTHLKKGEVSGPVKTDDGWHLLKLEDTRTETVGQSTAMRDQLREAAERERVMNAIKAFVESLKKKYGVTVDAKRLASLDYGSEDQAVQKRLKESRDVVATLPWKKIEVAELTRKIRFQYFHGIEGKADAAALRDKVLDEWIIELLLRQEAGERGYDSTPEVMAQADAHRRELMREAVGKKILDVTFQPTPDDVQRYYDAHRGDFTSPPRVRADAVVLADEDAAHRFRKQLDGGAKLRWLAGRTPEVTDANPARFADLVTPDVLGLRPGEAVAGRLAGPVAVDGAWVVASVVRVEPPAPAPLEACRPQVLEAMKRDRVRDLMTRAIVRLRGASRVDVARGATDVISARLAAWSGGVP